MSLAVEAPWPQVAEVIPLEQRRLQVSPVNGEQWVIDLDPLNSIRTVAIDAGGTTTWERCCLGLPSQVISIAENQRLACGARRAKGHPGDAGRR
jgi:hypothetical protein